MLTRISVDNPLSCINPGQLCSPSMTTWITTTHAGGHPGIRYKSRGATGIGVCVQWDRLSLESQTKSDGEDRHICGDVFSDFEQMCPDFTGLDDNHMDVVQDLSSCIL